MRAIRLEGEVEAAAHVPQQARGTVVEPADVTEISASVSGEGFTIQCTATHRMQAAGCAEAARPWGHDAPALAARWHLSRRLRDGAELVTTGRFDAPLPSLPCVLLFTLADGTLASWMRRP